MFSKNAFLRSWPCQFLTTLLLIAGMTVSAAPPLWWSEGNPPVIDANAASNNHGLANIGQAKFMAKRALESIQIINPGLAASIEADLVGPEKIIPSWDVPAPGSALAQVQRSPLLVGQLKAIAAPFYEHIAGVNPDTATWLDNELTLNQTKSEGSIYPWTGTSTDDHNRAPATVGQLKACFALHFTDPAQGDSTHSFAQAISASPGGSNNPVDSNYVDGDGDGLSNAEEALRGTFDDKEHSDEDNVPDSLDAIPWSDKAKWRTVPEARYAVIEVPLAQGMDIAKTSVTALGAKGHVGMVCQAEAGLLGLRYGETDVNGFPTQRAFADTTNYCWNPNNNTTSKLSNQIGPYSIRGIVTQIDGVGSAYGNGVTPIEYKEEYMKGTSMDPWTQIWLKWSGTTEQWQPPEIVDLVGNYKNEVGGVIPSADFRARPGLESMAYLSHTDTGLPIQVTSNWLTKNAITPEQWTLKRPSGQNVVLASGNPEPFTRGNLLTNGKYNASLYGGVDIYPEGITPEDRSWGNQPSPCLFTSDREGNVIALKVNPDPAATPPGSATINQFILFPADGTAEIPLPPAIVSVTSVIQIADADASSPTPEHSTPTSKPQYAFIGTETGSATPALWVQELADTNVPDNPGDPITAHWHRIEPPSVVGNLYGKTINTRGEILSKDGTKIFRNGRWHPFTELTDPTKWDNFKLTQLDNKGILAGTVKDLTTSAGSTKTVLLVPLEIKAHKRGTLNTPGLEVPSGTGQFGYETVMMENGDCESSATSTSRDCIESGASASLSDYRKANDDDLVKVVLKWPVGFKPAGASLKLLHDGMQVDATQATADAAVSTIGSSRLNFYKADGTRITDPATDLELPNLDTPPANAYFSKIVTEGEVVLFIEGQNNFGYLPDHRMERLGGALLRLEFKQRATAKPTVSKLLVYRGGFLVWHQSSDAPGTIGQLEFRDGKGRISHKTGGKGSEFKKDIWDMGNSCAIWNGRSGKLKDGTQGSPGPGLDYDITEVKAGRLPCGRIPPGWWWVGPFREISAVQDNYQLDDDTIMQGPYCRWLSDDGPNPYRQRYRYLPGVDSPDPVSIKYKFDLLPIQGTSDYGRYGIQIHCDGQKNGTAGCIGIQSVADCKAVEKTLRAFNGLKLRSDREIISNP